MKAVPSHPVLDCAAAKAWESRLLVGDAAEWEAMQRAGAALAGAITADFQEIGGLPADSRLLVLMGKGHNGGDALLAARTLLAGRSGARVVVVPCPADVVLRPLTKRSLESLQRDAPGRVRIASPDQALAATWRYDVCLDGIFGFQFRPPMDPATAEVLGKVNAHPGIRLRAAVDLPSGVAEPGGETAFRADFTYATGIVKRPLLSADAASFLGRLRYLDLGFFDADEPAGAIDRMLTAAVLDEFTRLRAARTDKRTFGHVFVVGGSRSFPGAVVLAVRAALRSGAGLVTAFVPERLAPEYAARHPEAMWVGCPETTAGGLGRGAASLIEERLARATAMVIGPGLGAEVETLGWVTQVVASARVPLVLDADALRPEVIVAAKDQPVICTPHAGEYQRIAAVFPLSTPTPLRGALVLKGPLTRVTDGRTNYYSPYGGPVLARGGSGDVLAGLISGLLAQQPADPLRAACQGVVWHGRAADLLARTRGQVAVEISEILEQLGPALTS
jgi:hydroxyethylthiazole kinase-like uncharacterized protein yjeF